MLRGRQVWAADDLLQRVDGVDRAPHGRVDEPDVVEHDRVRHGGVHLPELRQRAGVVALVEQREAAVEALGGFGFRCRVRLGCSCVGGESGEGEGQMQGADQCAHETCFSVHLNGLSLASPRCSARPGLPGATVTGAERTKAGAEWAADGAGAGAVAGGSAFSVAMTAGDGAAVEATGAAEAAGWPGGSAVRPLGASVVAPDAAPAAEPAWLVLRSTR